ncbi:MAG: transposase [Verrucomicrobiota bacterium]
MVGAGLLAWLLTSKFVDHLPLHGMAALLKRQHGVDIPRNALGGWVEQTTELLRSVYRAMQPGGLLEKSRIPKPGAHSTAHATLAYRVGMLPSLEPREGH